MAGWARLSGGSVSMDLLPGSRRAVCTASGSGTPSGLMMSRSLSVLRSRCRAGPKVPWTALPIPPQRPHCVEGSPRGEVILCGEDRGPELQSPAALLLRRLGSWGWVPGGQVPGAGWRGGGAPHHHPRGESVDHVGISQDHQVQPAAAPLPARGHAPLMAAALQQVPDLLRGDREGPGAVGMEPEPAACPALPRPLTTTPLHARSPAPGMPAPAEPHDRRPRPSPVGR